MNPLFKTYKNLQYKIELKYPYDWYLDDKTSDRYTGENGFFQVGLIQSNNDIDTVTNMDAYHITKPYGNKPIITKYTIKDYEARVIMPSDNNQASIIIKYKKPVIIDQTIYQYLIIWADKEHIMNIIKTINIIND